MRALRVLLFLLLGLLAGFVVVAVLGLLLIPGAGGDSGGREMFIFFGLAPLGALIGAIAGLLLGLKPNRQPPA